MTQSNVHDLIRRGAEIRLKEIAETRTALEREQARLVKLLRGKRKRKSAWTAAQRAAAARRMKALWKTKRPQLIRAITAAHKNGS